MNAGSQDGNSEGGPVAAVVAANDEGEAPTPSIPPIPSPGVPMTDGIPGEAAAQDPSELTTGRAGHEAQGEGGEAETAR